MLGDPHRSLPQRLLLLIFYPGLTHHSHSSSFLVGHTEYVVRLNSSIHTAIAWNRLFELLNLFIFWNTLDSEESLSGVLNGLSLVRFSLVPQSVEVMGGRLIELMILILDLDGSI